ncbi:MAG TPA: aldolase/citrate lyase family protein, partial [Acetobacteraceae bacterium]|nr:aldolase/citrate lyase family protein [Acetobacteraceae bacterium]
LLPEALENAGRGGADVFVRIDKAVAYADINAAVMPGLRGVVLPDPESAGDVEDVDAMLGEREREAGIPQGELEILVLLGTARGIWNVREIVHASARVASVAIDEARLCQSMRIVPTPELDPLSFSRGRVIVEALAAVRLPLGIGHPLGALPREVGEHELSGLADRARNTGFKGALCPYPSWVAACNTAFTPSDEQVAYYREVRLAFAKGVARGTAAVPFPGGRMIDVPVDERAKLVIDWWERCQRRDAEKAAVARRLL